MKETSKQIHDRLINEQDVESTLELCEKYHQERMKSSLPSEQETEALFSKCSSLRFDNNTKLMTLGDFKDALTLLTKGDR